MKYLKLNLLLLFAVITNLFNAVAHEIKRTKVNLPINSDDLSIIDELSQREILKKMESSQFYVVDHDVLNDFLSNPDENSVNETLEKLKNLLGEDVDIREVDILKISLATQSIIPPKN